MWVPFPQVLLVIPSVQPSLSELQVTCCSFGHARYGDLGRVSHTLYRRRPRGRGKGGMKGEGKRRERESRGGGGVGVDECEGQVREADGKRSSVCWLESPVFLMQC